MKKFGVFAFLVLILSAAEAAQATPLSWSFQGAAYDGTAESGTFTYDAATNSVLGWDMGTYRGDFVGATFNSSLNDPTGTYWSSADVGVDFHSGWDLNFHYTQYDPVEISPGNYEPGWDYYTLQLDFVQPLTDAGGTIAINPGGAFFGSFFYFSNDSGGGSQYGLLNGSAHSSLVAVPEPVSVTIIGLGIFISVAMLANSTSSGGAGENTSCSNNDRFALEFGLTR